MYPIVLLLLLGVVSNCQARDRIIGLTGGPGTGKSSVIEILQKRGEQVIPETFTTLFNQAQKDNKVGAFFADPLQLRYDLMKHQIAEENARNKNKTTYVDETALGILFFGNKYGVQMPQELYEDAENRRYDIIFVFRPLPKEFYKQTDVRQETYEQSKELHEFLKKKYQETGLKIIYVPFASPEQRADFIQKTIKEQYHYADLIPDVINCFAGKNTLFPIKPFLGPIKLIEVPALDRKAPYRFFGIEKDQQETINFPEFKKKLTTLMRVKRTNGLQVIGDSNQFSEEGTEFARPFLKKRLERAGLVGYGFTGYKTAFKSDVNTLVNEYLDEHPEQAYRVLANILGQTTVALNQWGTSGSPYVRNFVVVYNSAGAMEVPKFNEKFEKISGFTTFGDDMIVSDYLFSAADNDRFVCLEGGAQSFKQSVNGLVRNIPVTCVYNIRKAENEKFFSAARFFKMINDAYASGNEPSKEQVKEIYNTYAKSLKSLWDATRPDYETKKAIFERAIKEFIEDGIYEKIPSLCSFYNAKTDLP